MKVALLTAFGPPENLKLVEVPAPALDVGMVRVRIRCVGLNFADVFSRLGVYPSIPQLPFVPGIEYSGEIIECGPRVKGVKKGDRVMGFTRQGAYAEEVCVPPHFVQKLPPSMTYEQGAAFLVTYLSAWHGLRTLAHTQKGETVLIHAAAGGVGTACLQLGKVWGCTMIGTASTPEKLALAQQQGAAHVINYERERVDERVREITAGRGVDVVMDSVGGRVMKQSWSVLAPLGRYVLFGFAAASGKRRLHYLRMAREFLSAPLLSPMSFPSRNVSLMGFNLYFLADHSEVMRSAGKELLKLFTRRRISPVIDRVFPFDRIAEAHAYLQGRQSKGKVLLRLG